MASMEKVNTGPVTRVTPSVVGTVECANCRTGYVPTPKQAETLFAIAALEEWTATATEYAVEAGWFRRADGLLLCVQHADLGDGELPKRVGWLELCRSLPSRRETSSPTP